MNKLLTFIILLALSFTSNAALINLDCAKSDGLSVSITIDNKKKTAKYGYLDEVKYNIKGDFIYWTVFTTPEQFTEPMIFYFYLNTKTGLFKSSGNGASPLRYTRNCFKSLDI